jgi:DNA-binding GntR family transcriptional regulator
MTAPDSERGPATGTAESPAPRAARVSRVDRAYREIKRRVLGNFYPPGLRVLEQELAHQLGVSRTPVREALIRLEQEGLVEIVPRHGMRVVPISPEDMREIYEVITSLEARAAERLAERHPDRAAIAPMIEAQEAMEQALEHGDLDAWATADERFHRALVELCGNRRLAQTALAVFDQVHRARMVTLRIRPLPTQSNVEHEALIEAILAGDPDRAWQLHHDHLSRAMELLTEILKRYNLEQL